MFHFTLDIGGKSEEIAIPNSWGDLNWITYIEIEKVIAAEGSEDLEFLEVLTGISKDVISRMIPEHYNLLIGLASFYKDPLSIERIPDNIKQIDIGQETWEKLIHAQDEFKKVSKQGGVDLEALRGIVLIYTDEDLEEMELMLARGYADHFFAQFVKWSEDFRSLGDEPDDNEIAAGIDRIQNFGWFATLDTLSKGDPLKYDAMLQLPAISIYRKQQLDKELREYGERLQDYEEFTNKNEET